MPKGYWIIQVDVTEPERWKAYMAATPAALAKFGARFLVRGGTFTKAEGESRARNSLIEFPSYEAAQACFASPEYQAAKRLRDGAAAMDVVIIEGYEGPQP